MAYTITRGDTLTGIAKRYHTSIGKLLAANPGLKRNSVLSIGKKLALPGQTDDFRPSRPSPMQLNPQNVASGANPVSVAKQYLGQNIATLKRSGSLAANLDKWPSNKTCCANFVSACLQKAGQIPAREHNDSVRGLANTLAKDPHFKKVSLANAKPGDVVCFDVPGEGHYAHVEMYAGRDSAGRPMFIGSNNVNRDGTQRISEGHVGYGIDAIYQYQG